MKTTSKKTLSTQKKLIIKNAKSEPEPSIEIIKEETPILDNEINNPFTVVAIGASAGGLDAITQLLQNLSPNTGILTWMSKHPLIKRHSIKPTPEDAIDNNNPDLKTILDLLHKIKNVDFSHYKMNTIKRRMLRRMLIHKIKSIDQYADLLLQTNNEVDILYQDLLINVTEFFRDTEAFLLLKKIILPDSSIPANIIPKKTPISANGNLGNAFDSVLLSQYVPASMIINYDLKILQFKGLTASYLQNSSGKASFNILKMAHLEITFELRNAIYHAIKTKQIVRKTGIEMNRDVEKNTVQIVNSDAK